MLWPFIRYINTRISFRTAGGDVGIIPQNWISDLAAEIEKITGHTGNVYCVVSRNVAKRGAEEEKVIRVPANEIKPDDEVISVRLPKEVMQKAYQRDYKFQQLLNKDIGRIEIQDYAERGFIVCRQIQEAMERKNLHEYETHYLEHSKAETLSCINAHKMGDYEFLSLKTLVTVGLGLGLLITAALYSFKTTMERSLDPKTDAITTLLETGDMPKSPIVIHQVEPVIPTTNFAAKTTRTVTPEPVNQLQRAATPPPPAKLER